MAQENEKKPNIVWHHGTCDNCGKKYMLVCHFGYKTQAMRDYRICLKCMQENAQIIMYGWLAYKVDDDIDRMYEGVDEDGSC